MNLQKLVTACRLASGAAAAQSPATVNLVTSGTPVFRVTVTSHTTKAINYQHRSGSTKVDFAGTELLPLAKGQATVESKQGRIDIDAEFSNLQPATRNGAEFLTYVLWAITPEGRMSNLGEILLNGTRSKISVSTELQVFGLIVTAEPYYAVSQPSDLIVMENRVRTDTAGVIESIDAKYELLQRAQYQRLANPLALKPDKKVPLELYEARNAVAISRGFGADRFAAETFQKAEKSLAASEAYQARNAGRKPVAMMAREAVQMAEDARIISVKRQEEAALNAERQMSQDREARAESGRVAAQEDASRVRREAEMAALQAKAETNRLTAEKLAQSNAAQAETDRVKRDNDARAAAAGVESEARLAAAKADGDRLKMEGEARLAAAKADADRLKTEGDARLATAAAEADRLKLENESQRQASQAALDAVAKQKAKLEAEKVELRNTLLQQFNAILQTRDTARGLIVNMSDVLFDTAKFSLRPLAREKLAKVAGIVSGHSSLRLDVEGHTDSVGTDEYNQTLSEQRVGSVRDYLVAQGMASSSVSAKGFGESLPVATNDTAPGRQLNRRVELVISGDVIGTAIGIPIAAK